MGSWSEYLKIFIALLSVVDPVGAIPVFLGHATDDKKKNRRLLKISLLTATGVLLAAALAGQSILKFFGISLPAFRVSGGILVGLMGFELLHAHKTPVKHTPEEDLDSEHKDAVAVVPLGIPLLGGPGAISTLIVYSHPGTSWVHTLIICLIALVVMLITWLTLIMASPLA